MEDIYGDKHGDNHVMPYAETNELFDDKKERFIDRLLYFHYEIRETGLYRSDMAAFDYLMDVQDAIDAADLTVYQKESLRLVYNEGYSPTEAAEIREVSERAVAASLKLSIRKIAEQYKGEFI